MRGRVGGRVKDRVIFHLTFFSRVKTSAGKEGAQFSKTVLNDLEEPRDEFLNKLVEDIYKLMPHHFVSENQKIFLKACKSNLDKNTCLILMDFSENFAFICQDSTQGYYYNNSQATVHPFAVYYKDEASEELKILNFCVISDCTKHTAVAINIFQERVLEKLKELLPWIKNIIYFSDGAPTQYKNKNHFINLCHHEEDFRFKVISHNFSETSHGKNVCDGIGATVKKLTRASLQRPINNQIQTARQMFDYCQDNISGIRFLYVNQQDVEARDRKLHSRFQAARRISDTRIHHYFEPISQSRMKIKIFSADDEFALVNIA